MRRVNYIIHNPPSISSRPGRRLVSICLLLLTIAPATFAAADAPAVVLKTVAEGFVSPLNLVPLSDDSGRLLIADQVGAIRVLNKDGTLELFADLAPRMVTLRNAFDERGLLGLALHPKFKENRRVFIYYSAPLRSSAPTNFDHTIHLSEFKATSANLARLDLESERILLEIDEPQFNHNCGRMAFGPDGFLYVGVGDGGNANDEGVGHLPDGNGQSTTTLLGKILRLDVDKAAGANALYSSPSDNPFVGDSNSRPEIFAYGLRNPWGISFDRGGSHELFAADVGQDLFEEVNIVVKGGNYGWRAREGFHGFDPRNPKKSPENAPTVDARGKPFVEPILEYPHPPVNRMDLTARTGVSITGGYVYRGKALPHLDGKYVFGDWSRSWALPLGVFFAATRPAAGKGPWSLELLDVKMEDGTKFSGFITAFGEDSEGELYVLINGRTTLTGTTGKVYKMVR
jgi:glucose/arabinose dehydrogenase